MGKNFYVLTNDKLDCLVQEIANAISDQYSKKEIVNEIKTKLSSMTTSIDTLKQEFIPVGTVIEILGKSNIPDGYVKCDGSIYSIAYRKELAEFIKDQFGSYDFFGGNGISTFAVPSIDSNNPSITKCIKI